MIDAEQLESEPAAASHSLPHGANNTRAQVRTVVAPCPLCGCGHSRLAFRDNGYALRACSRCELFFVDPYPTRTQQHLHVRAGDDTSIEILDCARRYAGERLYYDRHFNLIAEECRGAASLLDVGCGTGHLLERLASQPSLYRAGIELNPEAAEWARRVSRCDIFQVPFEEFHSSRKFDVVTMINVFSHIPSFEAMFHSVRLLLRPGGKFILRTSEMAGNVSRWNQFHWGIPDDLHFLGLRTLEFVCGKYGFAIARHLRTPCENELFSASRWRQMGRNTGVNLIKRAGLSVPGFLPAARKAYKAWLGERLFVSFIVLTPIVDKEVP